MKYFFVEGILKKSPPIPENIMQDHINYSKKAMDNGLILMTATKSDMSGPFFIMKSKSFNEINDYLSCEPLNLYDIQDYKITEFKTHYCNKSLDTWFIEEN